MKVNIVFIPFILLFLMLVMYSCSKPNTEVVICSSIHGLHKENSNYTYEDLYDFVDTYDPDLIGVEIREQDIDSTRNYLKKFYPLEMYEIISKYNSKTILGVDWLGSSIEKKTIPDNYFETLDIIKLQKLSNKDSLFQISLEELEKLSNLKNEIASSSSIYELNSGRYDSLNTIYYHKLESLYKDTPYHKVADFYRDRDIYITNRIIEIISNNRNKKMIFIVGADHRSRAIEAFKNKFSNDETIRLVELMK